MDYDKLRADDSFHRWREYAPLDVQYLRYAKDNPSLVAVGHKIEDLYYAFSNARASFMFADSADFGDLSGDNQISRLYTKTHFLIYAVIEYAICLDLSWQIVWAFVQPASLEYLMTQKYKEMERDCNRDSVLAQLQCAISQRGYDFSVAQRLKDTVMSFDNDEDTIKLRSIYNAIKHQGTIHFEGLGENYTHFSFGINGTIPPVLSRRSYTVEEIERLLFSYHEKFEGYMNELIAIIMPDDYLENTMGLVDAINQAIILKNAIKL